jgi:hypothetical protein
MGLYGSPQIGYHAGGPTRRRRFPRWLKIVLIALAVVVGGFVALVVGLAILIAAHVIPEPATSSSSPAPTSPAPQACSPSPCASSHGLVLLVSAVDRNWQPPSPRASYETKPTPKPGFHFVRLQVAFQDQSGEHAVYSGLELEDPLGYTQFASLSYEDYCRFTSGTTLAPGGSTQPEPLCYEVGGPVDGKLTLLWTPDAIRLGDQCFTKQLTGVVDCSRVTVRILLP